MKFCYHWTSHDQGRPQSQLLPQHLLLNQSVGCRGNVSVLEYQLFKRRFIIDTFKVITVTCCVTKKFSIINCVLIRVHRHRINIEHNMILMTNLGQKSSFHCVTTSWMCHLLSSYGSGNEMLTWKSAWNIFLLNRLGNDNKKTRKI